MRNVMRVVLAASMSASVLIVGATTSQGAVEIQRATETLALSSSAHQATTPSSHALDAQAKKSRKNVSTKVPGTRSWRKSLMKLINDYRASHGLSPYKTCKTLMNAAQDYAVVLASNNWHDHTGPDGSIPFDRVMAAGYTPTHLSIWRTTENLAYGYPSVKAAFEGWKNSPGHNAAMLDRDLKHAGLGYARWTAGGHKYDTKWALSMGEGGRCKPPR